MNRGKAQFARLMALDGQIRDGQFPNCLTFSKRWEVSQKTVQRDIDFLRDQLGAPLGYDREKKGFFYTDEHWFLPSVSLSEGELVATLLAARALEQYRGTPIAADLERIVRKLSDLLPEQVEIQPEWLGTRFTFTGPPARPVAPEIWTTVMRGLLRQRTLEIVYRSAEATEDTRRKLDPYHLANLSGEWYVFGWCHRKEQVAQFALPRIRKAKLLDAPFNLPADFDPARLLSTAFGRMASEEGVHEIRLLFSKDAAEAALERQWHRSQKVKRRASGEVEISFMAAGLEEVAHWVLAWGHYVQVLGPPALRENIRNEVRLMATALGPDRGGATD